MKEQLFGVGIRHKKTGEKLTLHVWAAKVSEANRGLLGPNGLIGPDAEYDWTGSGPVYDDNGDVITRER